MKNKKIVLILMPIVFILIIFVCLLVNNSIEKKNGEHSNKLAGNWSNNSGVSIMLDSIGTSHGVCMVYMKVDDETKEKLETLYPEKSKEIIKAYTPDISNCRYNIKSSNNTFTMTFDIKIPATETDDKFTWKFKYNNDFSKIERIDDGVNNDAAAFIRSEAGDNENSVYNELSNKKGYYKAYYLAGNDNVGKASIEFKKNNKCIMNFNDFKKTINLGGNTSLYVTYSDGICTYTTDNEKDFIVHYDGTFYVINGMNYIVNNAYVLQSDNQDIKLSFNDDYSKFTVNNGQFEIENHALFFKEK